MAAQGGWHGYAPQASYGIYPPQNRQPYNAGDRQPYAGGDRQPYAGGGDRQPYAAPDRQQYAGGDRQPYAAGGAYQGGPPASGRIIPQGPTQVAGQPGPSVAPPQKRAPPPPVAGAGEQGPAKQPRQGPAGGYHGAAAPVHVPPPPHSGAPAAPAPPPAVQSPAKETYVVSTIGRDTDEVVVRTLMGEYVEKGVNHGRKVYMKVPDRQVPDDVDVLLYYWDNRDGPSFEGWWFGNKLGGTQVWSHNKDNGILPPEQGWKIPWDGQVRPTLVVKNKEAMQQEEYNGKLQSLTDEVNRAEAEASNLMDQAKAASSGGTADGFAAAEQLLFPQMPVLAELVKRVQSSEQQAAGASAKAFQQLGQTIKSLHDAVTGECSGMRSSRQQAEQDQKQAVFIDRDTKILEELLPEAIEKTNVAEDTVEKTIIASEMITSCGDDDDMVRHSIEETERSAKAAQAAIGEARIFLNAKLASTRRFIDKVRERASSELGKLQQQLQDAQNKLNPLKTVRQDYNQRKEAQKIVAEVEEKVVLAEVDVDRAEEMVNLLTVDTPTKDVIAQAHTALQVAENHINKAMQLYDTRKAAASGVPAEELGKIGPRGQAARTRITELRAALKAANERATTESYLEEASTKLLAMTDALAKVEDCEARFRDGADVSLEETLSTVKESESAAAHAQTASSMARMFIQMKLLEVKRFSSGPAAEATQKMTDFQKQLEEATKRLSELKSAVNKRKRLALVREAESRVSKAEVLVEKVKEAASIFADDGKLMKMSSEEMRVASEKTMACEKEANDALAEVRKFVTARQIESKGKDASVEVSAELIKFQTRLSGAQTEVTKQRKLFTSVEQRLAVKRLVDEAEKKLTETEGKVAKVTELINGLNSVGLLAPADRAQETDRRIKEAELAAQEAQTSARITARYLEAQSRSQGYAKDAMGKLDPRMKQCNEKVLAASAQIKERSEKIFVKNILEEAQGRVAECEEALKKAVEAEQPFLDTEADSKNPAGLAAFLQAVQAAQQVAQGCKSYFPMKRLAVRRLSEAMSQSSNAELSKMQATIDSAAKKLSEMRNRATERKRFALQREAMPPKAMPKERSTLPPVMQSTPKAKGGGKAVARSV